MDNRLLSQLPDELYRVIMEYNSSYMKEIPRWNEKTKKWRSHCNVKCCVCKKPSPTVALCHLCDRCIFNKTTKCCDNTLICWSCAH